MSDINSARHNTRLYGDGNWSAWDSLIINLMQCVPPFPFLFSSISSFRVERGANYTTKQFGKDVNVDRLIRGLVVDIFTVFEDGYIHFGNNYGFYHNPGTFLSSCFIMFAYRSFVSLPRNEPDGLLDTRL